MIFPARTLINSVKAKWEAHTKALTDLQTELVGQRTNCLVTLQTQGADQVKLLGEAVSTLNAMHLSQVEMVGYLKGKG